MKTAGALGSCAFVSAFGVRARLGSDLGLVFKTHEAEQGKPGLELWELKHEVLGFSREALGQGVREDPGSGCF